MLTFDTDFPFIHCDLSCFGPDTKDFAMHLFHTFMDYVKGLVAVIKESLPAFLEKVKGLKDEAIAAKNQFMP